MATTSLRATPNEVRGSEAISREIAPPRHGGARDDGSRISDLIRELLVQLGEDPDREGLARTPDRVERSLKFLTEGYRGDVEKLFAQARFAEPYDEMVLVKDIDFFSLCVHGKSLIGTENGAVFAKDVRPGMKLVTIDPDSRHLVRTEVVASSESKHRVRFRVLLSNERELVVTGEHPIFVAGRGFTRADHLRTGDLVLGTQTRKLCRETVQPKLGYSFGYALGAFASDGSADLMKDLLGGDTHSKTFFFPEVVRHDLQTIQGFLDGYIEGDGHDVPSGARCRYRPRGSVIVSANKMFLRRLATVISTSVGGPYKNGMAAVYVSRRWFEPRDTAKGWKPGFKEVSQEQALQESLGRVQTQEARVESIDKEEATRKSYTMYNFECRPFHSYLANGVLVGNCEHHVIPFFGKCHVAYIPDGRILGLSKIPRLVDLFSHRLQVQEQLTTQIAGALKTHLQPKGVAVVMEAQHLCTMMRGVQKQNTKMVTSSMLGTFRTDPKTRMEFLSLLREKSG